MLSKVRPDATETLPERIGHTIELQGRVVKLKTTRLVPDGHSPTPAHRGKVTVFTPRSRKRMVDLFQRLNLRLVFACAVLLPKFITLTYGANYPDPEAAKADLKAFLERLRRRWPHAVVIWRFEFQRRGAPHFHLIAFGLPFLPWSTLRQWWEEVIGWNPDHENTDHVRVEVKAIRSMRQLSSYVSKYCAKVEQSAYLVGVPYPHVGRWWGVMNREDLPLDELVTVDVSQGKWFFRARRIARRLYPGMKKHASGFTVYLDDPGKLFDCILGLAMGLIPA